MDSDLVYVQLGEQRGIGATMHLLRFYDETGEKNIIVDCGIGWHKIDGVNHKFVPDGNFLPDEHIDLIIFTHAHNDHIGAAPRLISEHPEAIVIIEERTFQAAYAIFEDGLKIMKDDQKKAEKSGQDIGPPLYDERDVDMFLQNRNLLLTCGNEWLQLDRWPDGWQIGFHHAGHDIGAISIFIETPSGKKVILTGDISSHKQNVAKGVMLPDQEFLGDFLDSGEIILITEGTNANRSIITEEERNKYGSVLATNIAREQIRNNMYEAIEKVEERGGVLFFAAFAKQRVSELAKDLVEKGYHVHIDGMGQTMSLIEWPLIRHYVETGQVVFIEKNFKEGREHRRKIAEGDDPCGHDFCIVISPSGTLEGGHAIQHCINLLPHKDNAIFFAGHIFENTPAALIWNVEYGNTLPLEQYGKVVPVNVRCEVQKFDFTAHDYRDALIERIVLSKAQTVLVHHCPGQEDYDAFEEEVLKLSDPPEIDYAVNGTVFQL